MRKTKLVDKTCETVGCGEELKGVWSHRRFCKRCSIARNNACRLKQQIRRTEEAKAKRAEKKVKKTYICKSCHKRPAPSEWEYCRICKNNIARISRASETSGNEIYFTW